MVKEMSGLIYFKGNGIEWLKEKIILNVLEKAQLKHTILPRSCDTVRVTFS